MLNIILLGLTSLLADFSSEMIVPILPFFIQALGGGGVAVGITFGVGDAVASILKVISGFWADRVKKHKLFVFLGYAFSATAKFLYPVASSWSQIAVIRPVERMGKGFRDAPRDAIVSESLPLDRRGLGFGIQRAMDSVGAILGSLTVLVLFVYGEVTFRTLFVVSAVIALVAVIPIVFVRTPLELKAGRALVSIRRLSRPLRRFLAVATLFALGNFSVAFFVLTAQASFGDVDLRRTLELTLFLYIFFSIFDAIFSGPAGALSDRIGRRRLIMASYILFGLTCLGFLIVVLLGASTTVNFSILLFLFMLYGLFRAAVDASQKALVSDLSDSDVRGTALGAFETLIGMAAIPSSVAAGFLWNIDPRYTFVFGLVFSVFALVGLWKLVDES